MIYILIAVVIILAISEILFMCAFWEMKDKIVDLKADQELFASLMKINQDGIRLMNENHARILELFTKAGEINDILIEQYKTIYEEYKILDASNRLVVEKINSHIEEKYSQQYEQYDDLKKTMLKVGHDILISLPEEDIEYSVTLEEPKAPYSNYLLYDK